jgi:hypothetical protein
VQHWEYRKLELSSLPAKSTEEAALNEAGKDGWQLVSITSNNVAYFKREVAKVSIRAKAAPQA